MLTIKPLRRAPFALWGIVLFAMKLGLDVAVSKAFGKPFSLLYYVDPVDAPLFHPEGDLKYYGAMWLIATPFLCFGLWLTARRLKDATAPAWLVFFFFIPFANLLFFLACALAPGRDSGEPAGAHLDPHGNPLRTGPSRSKTVALAFGGFGGAAVTLGSVATFVGLGSSYGAGLFMGAPAMSGFFATLIFGRLHPLSRGSAVLVTLVALWISFAAMIAFAIEGLICLLMVFPIATAAALAGSFVAYAVSNSLPTPPAGAHALSIAPFALIPMLLVAEVVSPLPLMEARMVESEIIVDAPPERVFPNVVAFPDLDPPTDPVFLIGVAAPTGAVIEGEGPGAIRRCQFTTGEFVEPIEVWDAPRELRFSVQEQPDPMREMSPWDIHPAHLDGYFRTTQGQFLLEPHGEGQTRLRGRTWYVLDFAPRGYWAPIAEYLVHRIHVRVLNHVAARSTRPRG